MVNLIYVLRSSGISQTSEALIARYIQKNECIFLFFIVFRLFQYCYNFGTTGPIQIGFSGKCTSPNVDFNQIENWKCHMFDFRLIRLYRITWYLIFIKKNINKIMCLQKKRKGLNCRKKSVWVIHFIQPAYHFLNISFLVSTTKLNTNLICDKILYCIDVLYKRSYTTIRSDKSKLNMHYFDL